MSAWQRNCLGPCADTPQESGPAGVTLLNLIGETKLTNAVDTIAGLIVELDTDLDGKELKYYGQAAQIFRDR